MQPNRRQILACAGAVACGWSTSARADKTSTFGGRAFGSYWRLSMPAGDPGERLRAAVERVIESVDCTMSPYRADSEISRFNAARSTGWVAVTPATHGVVAAALSMAQRCGGAFDPTVGPLVARLGFGPITGRRSGDHRQLALGAGVIRKADPDLSLDLCGIAKGHALDGIVAALDRAGLGSFLFELGGEVFARGHHPSGRPWQVAIEDPRADATGLAHLVALDGRAIATSGNKVNGYDVGGRRYGHIVDPLTGSGIGTTLQSVSVMADRAMLADGLATGMMAMGLARATAFARSQGLDTLLLVRDGRHLKSVTTGDFAARLLA